MYIADNKPDLILLDYEMPVTSGPQVLEMIRSETKVDSIPVIFLTGKGDRESVMKVLALKPDGYLLKSAAPGELVEAINTVMSGNTFICREAKDIINGIPEDLPAITLRERDILRLLANGYSIKETANRLCLAFETVHSYTKSLRQKLHCNNMASLVRKAIELHLI